MTQRFRAVAGVARGLLVASRLLRCIRDGAPCLCCGGAGYTVVFERRPALWSYGMGYWCVSACAPCNGTGRWPA